MLLSISAAAPLSPRISNMASSNVLACELRCLYCRRIPFLNWDKKLPLFEYFISDHHDDVQALAVSADAGCHLCRLFWWTLFGRSDLATLQKAQDLPDGSCRFRLMMIQTPMGKPHLGLLFLVGKASRLVIPKSERLCHVGKHSRLSESTRSSSLKREQIYLILYAPKLF